MVEEDRIRRREGLVYAVAVKFGESFGEVYKQTKKRRGDLYIKALRQSEQHVYLPLISQS